MHKKLLIKAFRKAKKEIEKETGVEPSVRKCAVYLSGTIGEINKFSFGEKSLHNLYNEAMDESGEEMEIKQPKVLEGLSKFMGYLDYPDFVKQNYSKEEEEEEEEEEEKIIEGQKENLKTGNRSSSRNLILILVLSAIAIAAIGYLFLREEQRWMVWQENNYVETNFSTNQLNSGGLKLFKQERIDDFKKILPNCETEFFNGNGSVKIWYGKNSAGEFEYFTALGIHPETGKTLKSITKYMIRKYVCESY